MLLSLLRQPLLGNNTSAVVLALKGIKGRDYVSEHPQFLKISCLKEGGGGKNVQILHGKPFGAYLQLLKHVCVFHL